MTNQEILTKALEKAIDGGWEALGILFDVMDENETGCSYSGSLEQCKKAASRGWLPPNHHFVPARGSLVASDFIFNHEFAKALWGEEDIMQECSYCKTPMGFQHPNPCPFASLSQAKPIISVWRYHLQQMVIADDPIAYLGEHL